MGLALQFKILKQATEQIKTDTNTLLLMPSYSYLFTDPIVSFLTFGFMCQKTKVSLFILNSSFVHWVVVFVHFVFPLH